MQKTKKIKRAKRSGREPSKFYIYIYIHTHTHISIYIYIKNYPNRQRMERTHEEILLSVIWLHLPKKFGTWIVKQKSMNMSKSNFFFLKNIWITIDKPFTSQNEHFLEVQPAYFLLSAWGGHIGIHLDKRIEWSGICNSPHLQVKETYRAPHCK